MLNDTTGWVVIALVAPTDAEEPGGTELGKRLLGGREGAAARGDGGMGPGVVGCGVYPRASGLMKIVSCMIALFACQSAFGAELEIRQPVNVVMVQNRSGLYNSAPLKNPRSLFYLKESSFEMDPKVLEALVAKAKGGFMKLDAPPPPTKLRVVLVNADRNGMIFTFRDDGKISYRGVRETGKGEYEDDDSLFLRGTFEDQELTGRMMEAWKASL